MAEQKPNHEPPTDLHMLQLFARDLSRCIDLGYTEEAKTTLALIKMYADDVLRSLDLEDEE
tara:strand:+ start:1322 stop:1504 length:183 start_codon:yes stop_codon:yes gene_type:complete